MNTAQNHAKADQWHYDEMMAAFVNTRTGDVVGQRKFWEAKIYNMPVVPGCFYVCGLMISHPGNTMEIQKCLSSKRRQSSKYVPGCTKKSLAPRPIKKIESIEPEHEPKKVKKPVRRLDRYIAVANPCNCSPELKAVEPEIRAALNYPPKEDVCAICGGHKKSLIKLS